jgi:hypothetical protein
VKSSLVDFCGLRYYINRHLCYLSGPLLRWGRPSFYCASLFFYFLPQFSAQALAIASASCVV